MPIEKWNLYSMWPTSVDNLQCLENHISNINK